MVPETNNSAISQRCLHGMKCLRDFDGNGEFRCRKPRTVGGVCTDHANCGPGLICGAWRTAIRRCYNEQTALGIGENCDPDASKEEPQCASTRDRLKCLPTGDGHVCHKVKNLFGQCSPEDNIGCEDERLQCDRVRKICLDA